MISAVDEHIYFSKEGSMGGAGAWQAEVAGAIDGRDGRPPACPRSRAFGSRFDPGPSLHHPHGLARGRLPGAGHQVARCSPTPPIPPPHRAGSSRRPGSSMRAQRTNVVEPIGRITRIFQSGQTLSAQLAIDAMTGASPTGARASPRPKR